MDIDLILLAAGNSRRFGSNKLFYEVDGKPMYSHMLEKLLSIAEQENREGESFRVVVVSQYGELLRDAKERGTGYQAPLLLANSPKSSLGMSYTIRRALEVSRNLHETGDLEGTGNLKTPGNRAAAFFLADMPWLSRQSILEFLKGFQRSGRKAGCMRAGECFGNPAVFSWNCFDELNGLSGDEGGKRILKRHLEDCYFYEVGEGELADIDVPKDGKGSN